MISDCSLFPCFQRRKSETLDGNSDLDPVLLVSGIGGSILQSKDKRFGFQTRVWVRIFLASLEFKKKLWSIYNPKTGYTESLDDNTEIVVPEDDYGLYAIDILDPSLICSPLGDTSFFSQNSGDSGLLPAIFSGEHNFSRRAPHFEHLGLFGGSRASREPPISLFILTIPALGRFSITDMVRPKRMRSGGSSSARPEQDEDYVPPTDVEEHPIESSRASASSSGAGASSSRGRRRSGLDPVPEVLGVPDTPLLKGLGEHISALCRNQERTPISGWRCTWKNVLTFYQVASPALRDALGRTPLGSFLTIPRIQSDRRLIAALCERWFGDTNTFHFPCCELAITPLDFVMLTGIQIVGEVIPPLPDISMDQAAALMGVSPAIVASDSGWEAGKVKLSWLGSILGEVALAVIDLDSPAFTSTLRVFLLFILGSCFFMTDRSCVDSSFLSLMDPIDRFDTFDWGGAIYASILAGLSRVSRGGGRSARFFYPFLEMWAHEYLDPFRPTLRIPDMTSFPRSSRWSAPCSKVDSHLLDKAREELDRLTMRRVTLRPFVDLEDMIRLLCRGARRFLGRRVAFSYLGTCEYFLGERVLHQCDGEFRIPLPPPEMTPILDHDAFMGEMRTAGVPIHHLAGEVVTHSFYLSWFRGVSIGPIMRPFSTRPGATEVGGKLVEKYFQMRPLLAILEEDNRALTEENARLRGRCATFEDPSVTLAEIPPHQCRPRPDLSFDFDADSAQDDDED
ncbi:hypothetical protein HHK36_020106 [Tetracentron sinense]|uniref:Aminotransferase-like plant mobile domain-containing protein n=2 Tax=Tetracentron sinense TaxID=13715 RepID=A0A834YYE7_TETSI|nr:hypothetical protein HHK36_020106 [Tetracentron sinense]